VIFNAHHEDLDFTLPPEEYGNWWTVVLDTADDGTWATDSGDTFGPGDVVVVSARSTIVLRRPLEVDENAALTAAATGDPSTPSSARAVRRNGPAAGDQAGGASPAAATSRAGALPPPRPALRRDGEAPQ
jgi:glycogen operon protein